MTTLAQEHDCLLLDLDGTVFRGHEPTPGALESLARVPARQLFVTNNASRRPEHVAEHLVALGFHAEPADVVTSAQSAARLLADQVTPGAAVLVVGTEALAQEIAGVGLAPVRSADDNPVAVVQGHSPDTGWAQLAEAALAIRSGAVWVAANVDLTLPSERGLLPGNGSMVAALRVATGCEPQVAGKPLPPLLVDALARGTFATPLMVGDRLDTDIAGANAAGLPSLMVLTGVSTGAEVVHAARGARPDYLATDLRGLHVDSASLRIGPDPRWRVEVGQGAITVHASGPAPEDPVSVLRAAAHAAWTAELDGFEVRAGDATASEALRRWSLLSPHID